MSGSELDRLYGKHKQWVDERLAQHDELEAVTYDLGPTCSPPEDCSSRSHRWPEGPNEDVGVCPHCWMGTWEMRPDGETYGDHLPDCSLPRRHESHCVPGGQGHPRAATIRGYWPNTETT